MLLRCATGYRHETAHITAVACFALSLNAVGQNDEATKRGLKTYLSIFINGYGGDPLPKEPKAFEKLFQTITK